ncbi:GNAT family N-acetyltransferase [Alteribacter lacisalsi]|nr:GNAT family protein [Alteribacter lacisalsi]
MTVYLEALSELAAEELLAFEQENRTYFASVIPDRGDAFFDQDNFMNNLQSLLTETIEGKCQMYTVKTEHNAIAGRINLVNIQTDQAGLKTAELGYRIGEAHKGKGFATAAISLALSEASRHKISRVEAMTAVDNIGSQVVLLKNGFHETGIRHASLLFEGNALDGIIYEKVLPPMAK